MGQQTTAHLNAFAQQTGIVPARGRRAETLERLSQLGLELIRVVELERSGIRDGDGHWHGTDVLAAVVANINRAADDDLNAWS
ncbi:MAG: hypothetical protein M3545_06400 [Acidobacteriota bacterium]|nr:hypothetical protein [Acidobacteriota bacterium]